MTVLASLIPPLLASHHQRRAWKANGGIEFLTTLDLPQGVFQSILTTQLDNLPTGITTASHGHHVYLLPHNHIHQDFYPFTLSSNFHHGYVQKSISGSRCCLRVMVHHRSLPGHFPVPPLQSGF